MKKSLLAIVLIAGGITFATAQTTKNENTLQQAPVTDTVKQDEMSVKMDSTAEAKAAEMEEENVKMKEMETAEMNAKKESEASPETKKVKKARKQME